MPPYTFTFSRHAAPVISYDEEVLWLSGNGSIRLRRVEADGGYAPGPLGLYPSIGGVVITGNIMASGLVGFYSFEENVKIELDDDGNELGAVGYQVSVDGGATWIYWDGATWSAPGPDDWNSMVEVDAGLPQLDVTKQYRFRARIKPDSACDHCPSLYSLTVGLDYRYAFLEDMVRTLKRYIESNLSIVLASMRKLETPGQTFVLQSDFTVTTVYAVYDITVDPETTNNLYQSYDPVNKIVTMNSVVAAGHVVKVYFAGSCGVFIVSADEDLQISTIPAVYVFHGEGADEKQFNLSGEEIEKTISRMKARKGRPPKWKAIGFEVMAVATEPNSALAMNSALDILLNDEVEHFIYSLAIGEKLKLIEYDLMKTSSEGMQGTFGKSVSFKLVAPVWEGDTVEVPLAEQIDHEVYSYVPGRL